MGSVIRENNTKIWGSHGHSLALSVLLASLDQTIVSTALPSIASQFNSAYDIGWVS